MNKQILYLLLAITLVASCRKDDDDAFDRSPDDRLNETLTKYQTALSSSTYGWNASLITGDGGSYRFYFSFDDKNRVQMYSDFDSSTATTVRESSYRLKALQQPSLIFDTYSYIHILSDPDGAVSGGAYGQGLKSDFEFAVDTVTTDSIRLTGRFNNSKLSLHKAAQGDRAIWANKLVTNGVVNFRNFWKINLYFKRLTYGNTDYELQFDTTIKRVTVSWIAGGQTQSVSRGYYFWNNGVYFSDPIVNGTVSIPGFSITGFNAGTQTLSVTVNGAAATIAGAGSNKPPINPDIKTAPDRWRQRSSSGSDYWISFDGFHKNGVDDAFGIKTLKTDTTRFYFLLYKANNNGGDAFFDIFLDSAKNRIDVNHGSWVAMNTFSNGITSFSEIEIRDPDVPWPAGPAKLTVDQMFIKTGYYFVQSSAYTYDQVSVSDPSTWISWYWVF
jgi:hypothetical protein